MASDELTRNPHPCERRGAPRATLGRRAWGLLAAAGVAGTGVGIFGAAAAVAAPAAPALRYTCAVSEDEQRQGEVRIDANVPESAVVGEPTPKFVIRATVPVSAADADELRKFHVSSVSGTADVKTRVTVAGKATPLSVRFRMTRTRIPASGPFQIKATGEAPARTFDEPGKAKITVGDLKAHVAASAGPVTVNLNLPCALDPDQNDVVASFEVTRAGSTTAPAPSGTAGTATSGTTGAQDQGGDAKPGTTGKDPAGPSGAMAETGSRSTGTLITLAAGTVALGAVATAAAFRFRSRHK